MPSIARYGTATFINKRKKRGGPKVSKKESGSNLGIDTEEAANKSKK